MTEFNLYKMRIIDAFDSDKITSLGTVYLEEDVEELISILKSYISFAPVRKAGLTKFIDTKVGKCVKLKTNDLKEDRGVTE